MTDRSSHQGWSVRKDILRNFAKLKAYARVSFFNKVEKRDSGTGVFL